MWNGLDYSVAVYDDGGNLLEWIARTKDQGTARAVYDWCLAVRPGERFVMRQRTRVVLDVGPKVVPFQADDA